MGTVCYNYGQELLRYKSIGERGIITSNHCFLVNLLHSFVVRVILFAHQVERHEFNIEIPMALNAL